MKQKKKFAFTKIKNPKIKDVKEACEYLEIIYNNNQDINIENAKRSYRKKSLKLHPDKNEGRDEEFKEINAAYQIIKSYIPQRSLFNEEEITKNSSYSNYSDFDNLDTTAFFNEFIFLFFASIILSIHNVKSALYKKSKEKNKNLTFISIIFNISKAIICTYLIYYLIKIHYMLI